MTSPNTLPNSRTAHGPDLSPDLSLLRARLARVRKPGRYLCLEHNAARDDFRERNLNFCLIFPDLYEIGMSHQGLQILYHLLNRLPGVAAHRAYTPDTDMEQLLEELGLPLCSLETETPLARYDVLGITLPYELCATNILTVLHLAGLPFRAAERGETHPLVLGGGSCAFNPEPVADFFDAILLGDAEGVIGEIAGILRQAKAHGEARTATLTRLARVPGLYVPAFFRPRYGADGRFLGMEALGEQTTVRRAVLPELDAGEHLRRPLVAAVTPVHDRLALEIARGCTRGCRFCQAGIQYRPVRERKPEDILKWASEGIANSGFEEMALLSLSTGDYSCIGDLAPALMRRFAQERVSLSLPSMRVGTLTPELMEEIRRVRKTGFTVAPEAGSERLRRVINKGITEADLLATCRDAFALGWQLIKFYFMIGLPTETEADVAAIAALAREARRQAGDKWRTVQINLGVGTFVPKAHTPFQWEAQLNVAAARARLDTLKRLLPPKGYHLKWQDPNQSFLEGVFSRGDRRLSGVIERAWQAGVRLDAWGEHFDPERWRQAGRDCGLELDELLRGRTIDEPLPWDHLDCGVSREFLLKERERAFAGDYTPDCRAHGCQGCGICDFETVRPVLVREATKAEDAAAAGQGANAAAAAQDAAKEAARRAAQSWTRPASGRQEARFLYRVHYRRQDPACFLGHLELLQLVFRVIRRAGLPIAYTQGFNPSPKVSFSQALPVGMESLVEYFDMELTRPVPADTALIERLNREVPAGLTVERVEAGPKKPAISALVSYEIRLAPDSAPDPAAVFAPKAAAFLASAAFPITRFRKGRTVTVDMRPLVAALQVTDNTVLLELVQHQGKPGVSPKDVLEQVFGLTGDEALGCRIVKTAVYDLPEGMDAAPASA